LENELIYVENISNFEQSAYKQMNYCENHKITGRFICFEKVNSFYPYKIMILTNVK